jgi:hypothetical protein
VQWIGCTPAVEKIHLPTVASASIPLEPVDWEKRASEFC